MEFLFFWYSLCHSLLFAESLKLVLPRPNPPGPGGGRWAGVGIPVACTGVELTTGVAAGELVAGIPPGGLTMVA